MGASENKAMKSRAWASIVYPCSAPEDWMQILKDFHLKILVSPLHDRDLDLDNQNKRPHYHCLYLFDGPVTKGFIDSLIKPLNGTKSAERVYSVKSFARYLAHLDESDPKQAKYDPSEIVSLGGADIAKLLELSKTDKYELLGEMIDFCEEYGVHEFSDLLRYARENRNADWFPVLADSAYLMRCYIDSLRYKNSLKVGKETKKNQEKI